jgi:hypothetical protein
MSRVYTGGTFGTAKDWGVWSPGTSGGSNDPQPVSSKTGAMAAHNDQFSDRMEEGLP